MEDSKSNKLEHLRWVLDKQVGWIVAAETKATTFIALNFAIFTALGTVFELKSITRNDFNMNSYGLIMATVAVVLNLISLYFLFNVFTPRLTGVSNATKSFVFFHLITARKDEFYTKETPKQDYENFAEDTCSQIYANAQIASIKHNLIRKGIKLTYLTIIFAILSIAFKILL